MSSNRRYQSNAERAFLRGVAALLSLAALLFVGFDTPHAPKNDIATHTDAEAYDVPADTSGVMFILRNVGGRIAVLDSLETAVLEILDVCVSELPEPYAAELEGGVIIGSVSELVSVISEYAELTSALPTSRRESSLVPE